MKKYLTIALVALGLFVAGTTTASAQVSIGTVDVKRVFDSYYKTKDADAQMSDMRAALDRELDERGEKRKGLEAEITKLNEEIKKPELSDEKRKAAAGRRETQIAAWQKMMKELQDYAQEQNKQIGTQKQRLMEGILADITKTIKERVQSENYDLVLDVSGVTFNQVPAVLYAKPTYDFTNVIIEKLNATRGTKAPDAPAPGGAAAPAPAPGAAPAAPAKPKK